jgi:16S rRNA (guanine527-N7)-methyltransferase
MIQELDRFAKFLELFEKWNNSINLSAARSRAELLEHVEDSLVVVPLLRAASTVLDVGSGGGFPVVIAALELPSVRFVSLEPVHKKHAFLKTAVRELGMSNLDAFAERVEDHPTHDYDVAMSRATFDLREWLELGARYVRAGGMVIGFEGQQRDDLGTIERHSYSIASKPRALVTRLVNQPA